MHFDVLRKLATGHPGSNKTSCQTDSLLEKVVQSKLTYDEMKVYSDDKARTQQPYAPRLLFSCEIKGCS